MHISSHGVLFPWQEVVHGDIHGNGFPQESPAPEVGCINYKISMWEIICLQNCGKFMWEIKLDLFMWEIIIYRRNYGQVFSNVKTLNMVV